MRCPKCQSKNLRDAKYCRACGTTLERVCSRCQQRNLPGSQFCNQCGYPLGKDVKASKRGGLAHEGLERLRRHLPTELKERVWAHRKEIEGERREVTVLFCDMEAFTELAEGFDAEEIFAIMGEVQDVLIRTVYRYGGTVNDISGDGIMALFGAPVALEDGPRKSLLAAWTIHRAVSELSENLRTNYPSLRPIRMRIGVHTGPVVFGKLGNDLRVELTALGDTVNLAARMEGLAEPGSTYLTERTFRLTEGFFDFEPLGEIPVRGMRSAVRTYRLIASGKGKTRFDVHVERGLTPLVGRRKELEFLVEALERAKRGRGQAVSIVGEGGMGKSRILYEFQKRVANEDLTFLLGRCLSYGERIPYHPILEIIRSTFHIEESDPFERIEGKLRDGLDGLGLGIGPTRHALLDLLTRPEREDDPPLMNREVRKDRFLEALRTVVLRAAEIKPLVIAIEDLHRLDQSSEEVLKDILNHIGGARILLLLTYRPEFGHPWETRSYHSPIHLAPLSQPESRIMVAHVLGTEDPGRELEELLWEKAEGNPFFIEEFLQFLKTSNVLEPKGPGFVLPHGIPKGSVPTTVQDLVMARVDALPPTAKEILRIGSVIAREFSFDLIRRVTRLPEKALRPYLALLQEVELLYERGHSPHTTYVFNHALTSEVVYNGLLSAKKREIHERVAEATEEIYHESLDEHSEILAEHYIQGENMEKGAHFAGLASKKAEKAGALNDAVAYARKAVACLEKLPPRRDILRRIVDIKTKVGLCLAEMIHFEEALNEIKPMAGLAKTLDYPRPLPKIYTISGAYNFFVREDFPLAMEDLERSIRLSEQVGDAGSLVLAQTYLGVAQAFCCDFKRARTSLEQALERCLPYDSLWGISLGKSNLSLFGYNWEGRLEGGYRQSEEAIRFAERSGDPYSKSVASSCHGWSCYYRGALDEAEQYLNEACHHFEKIDIFSFWALAKLCLGLVYFERKRYAEAMRCHEESIALFERGRLFPSFVNFNEVAIRRAMFFDRRGAFDLAFLEEHHKKNRFKIYEGWIPFMIAEMALQGEGDLLPLGREWILKAIEADRQNGMLWNLGRDYHLEAQFLKREGRKAELRERLERACAAFEASGARARLERVRGELWV